MIRFVFGRYKNFYSYLFVFEKKIVSLKKWKNIFDKQKDYFKLFIRFVVNFIIVNGYIFFFIVIFLVYLFDIKRYYYYYYI